MSSLHLRLFVPKFMGLDRQWIVLIGLFLQTQRPTFTDAACSCIDRTSGDGLGGVCCNLGSSSCDFTVRPTTVCTMNGVMCPRPLRPSAVGHFISGSISWRATGQNSVEFEIISTWRYSFNWPYTAPQSTYTGPCGYPGIGDKVPIVGISSSIVGNTSYTTTLANPLQLKTGSAFLQLESGKAPPPPRGRTRHPPRHRRGVAHPAVGHAPAPPRWAQGTPTRPLPSRWRCSPSPSRRTGSRASPSSPSPTRPPTRASSHSSPTTCPTPRPLSPAQRPSPTAPSPGRPPSPAAAAPFRRGPRAPRALPPPPPPLPPTAAGPAPPQSRH